MVFGRIGHIKWKLNSIKINALGVRQFISPTFLYDLWFIANFLVSGIKHRFRQISSVELRGNNWLVS